MAPPKSKAKNRRATAYEKAVLKAAKDRGLIKIDLRKAPSRYALAKVKQFEAVYHGEAAVLSVPKKARDKYSQYTSARGKLIVQKEDIREKVRYNARTGEITATVKGKGTRSLRGGKLRVSFTFKSGVRRDRVRSFEGKDAWKHMRAFMTYYNIPDWEQYAVEEYI